MNLSLNSVRRFLVISALVAYSAVAQANTTSVTPKGLASPAVDQNHGLPTSQNQSVQQLVASDWIITLLPAGYTPIEVSVDGNIVLLYKQIGDVVSYYRWSSDGNLENLGVAIRTGTPTDDAFLNSTGTIGMTKGTYANFGEFSSSTLVKWEPTDKSYQLAYRALIRRIVDYGAYGGPSENYFGSVRLVKLDDQGRMWFFKQEYDQTFPEVDVKNSLVVKQISGAETTIYTDWGNSNLATEFTLNGISRKGSYIYSSTTDYTTTNDQHFFLNTTELDFIPKYISENDFVIGSNFTRSGRFYFETDGIIRFPDGTREPSEKNVGTVTWVDSQSRLRGYGIGTVPVPGGPTVYPVGVFVRKLGSDGQPITPAQYDFVPEVPLSAPAGWTTDHTVAPGTIAPQIGFVVNSTTGASIPFVATPRVQLAVDSNRDGSIKFAGEDSSDVTSAANPFRFWINDGADGPSQIPGESSVQDSLQLSSTRQPNWLQSSITCERDLENFARLWLKVSGSLRQAIITGQVTLGLEWQSNTGDTLSGWTGSDGTPEIRIYAATPKHGDTNSTGGTEYLTDLATATDQVLHKSVPLLDVRKGFPGYFTPSAFADLTDAQPNLYLLFEGVSRGTGRLVITLNTGSQGNYTKIGNAGFVYMDLKNTKELYERWSVGDGPVSISSNLLASGGGSPLSVAEISTDRLPSEVKGLRYSSGAVGLSVPDDSNGNKYILYVHGWNMPPWEKDAFAETMLKRLYWQGYKGKFGTFQWPTTYSDSSTFNPKFRRREVTERSEVAGILGHGKERTGGGRSPGG